MKYTFKEIMDTEIYENTRVMFITGKYAWFSKMVSDTLKYNCIDKEAEMEPEEDSEVSDEFGLDTDKSEENTTGNVVDFATFMAVVNVPSITGKWYCKVPFNLLTSKQKEQLFKYIKEPSENGVLVVTSDDWKEYNTILKNRVLAVSKVSHLIQLSFPDKRVLRTIVKKAFEDKGIEIDSSALDLFMIKMSSAYDKYEEQIDKIISEHGSGTLDRKQCNTYMKQIDNYVIDDYINCLVNDTAVKSKIKILRTLENEIDIVDLLNMVLRKVNEMIEYRILINNGYIPIGINYFYKDILKALPNKEKYEKVNEWTFKAKASLASMTSLKDWEYMSLILGTAVQDIKIDRETLKARAGKALYDITVRRELNTSRLNNIIKIDDIIKNQINNINKIVYDEEALNKIQQEIEMANQS